ncbi:MAG: chemotaxis protein CheD [Brevinematales bacterium]|jgi:chemotaxis protein CheD
MTLITVGIGEYKVSNNPNDVLKTYALGSCVAVIIYEKIKHVAGMIHVALPDSTADKNIASKMPGHFADTGLPLLIEEMKKFGLNKADISIKLAGGANVLDTTSLFDIGKRNVIAIKKVLWKSGLGSVAEDIGREMARTVTFYVSTGEVTISNGKNEWKL